MRFLPYLIFAGGVLAFVIGVYFYGQEQGKDICEFKYSTLQIEAEEKHETLEQEIIRLPVTELRTRWCDWVRNNREKCLQANIPIAP